MKKEMDLPGYDRDALASVHDQRILLPNAELDFGRREAERLLHGLEHALPGGLSLLDDGRALVDVLAQVPERPVRSAYTCGHQRSSGCGGGGSLATPDA